MITKTDFSQWDAVINYDPINNTIRPTNLSKFFVIIAFGKLHRVLMIMMINSLVLPTVCILT